MSVVSTPRQRLLDAKLLDEQVITAAIDTLGRPEQDGTSSEKLRRADVVDENDDPHQPHRDNEKKRPNNNDSRRPPPESDEECGADVDELSVVTDALASADQVMCDLSAWRAELRRNEEELFKSECRISSAKGGYASGNFASFVDEEESELLGVAHLALASSRNLADRIEGHVNCSNYRSNIVGASSLSFSGALPPPVPRVVGSTASSIDGRGGDSQEQMQTASRLEALRLQSRLLDTAATTAMTKTPRDLQPSSETDSTPPHTPAERLDGGSGGGAGAIRPTAVEAAETGSSPATLLHRLRVRELMGEAATSLEARARREEAEDSVRQQCAAEEQELGLDLLLDDDVGSRYAEELYDLFAQFDDDDDEEDDEEGDGDEEAGCDGSGDGE
jgi:hypothetical protein